MRMKVSFSCCQIFLHFGSNFNRTFASFTFLTTIALTAPHYSESAIVDQNSYNCYSVIEFIDFCEGVILFTMESVYSHCYLSKLMFLFLIIIFI